jgi:hypothetical protein
MTHDSITFTRIPSPYGHEPSPELWRTGYRVDHAGTTIGFVFSHRTTSEQYTTSRISIVTGHPIRWQAWRVHPAFPNRIAQHDASYRAGWQHYTRGEAAEALVRATHNAAEAFVRAAHKARMP